MCQHCVIWAGGHVSANRVTMTCHPLPHSTHHLLSHKLMQSRDCSKAEVKKSKERENYYYYCYYFHFQLLS